MISLIAAMSRNRVIGMNGQLPWYLPEDLRRFRALTVGKPVIMGRKTFESLGKALPDRFNVVVTRQPDYVPPTGVTVRSSLEDALKLCAGAPEIMVIGGGEIYAQALPVADRIYLTVIDEDIEGDARFPEIGEGWQEIECLTGESDGLRYQFLTLGRR